MTRVLVLTLYSGENELEYGRASVLEQVLTDKGARIDQEIISDLGNREAHDRMAEIIKARSDEKDVTQPVQMLPNRSSTSSIATAEE